MTPMFQGVLSSRQIELLREVVRNATADARLGLVDYFCEDAKRKDDELMELAEFLSLCLEANVKYDYVRLVAKDLKRAHELRLPSEEDRQRMNKAENQAEQAVEFAEDFARRIQSDFNHGHETV